MLKKFVLAAVCGALCSVSAYADGWGGVSGQIVVSGAAPKPVLLHKKGSPIKDAEVCAAQDTYSEEVLVDEATKGLANAFIYVSKAPSKIHPDLKTVPAAKVTFDQKNCTFLPHAMVVRAGQTVEVISNDPIAHNTHTYPLRNQAMNVLVAPNTALGSGVDVPCKVTERLPHKVACDYHPWMIAYWLVVDHPYAAVTDKEGKFTIANLPEGEHEMVIWHEAAGYINRKYMATVKNGAVTELKPVSVDAAKLVKK